MRKIVFLLLSLLFIMPIHAQEATPELEEPLRLRPFTLERGEISGVAPSTWDELQSGAYIRDDGDIDNTYILHVSAEGVSAEELIDPFLAAYELEGLPESTESYDSNFSWTIYSFDYTPPDYELRVDIAVAEQENRVYVVILQSNPEENESLREQVFFPALDYFGLPLAEIQEALGYEILSPVELEGFGIESAYPTSWQEVNVGSYMRRETEQDVTTLLIQTSPDLGATEFAQLLLETLGLPTELPTETESFETSGLSWTIYPLAINQGAGLSMMIALAEDEQLAYMVVLLSSAEEAESLHDRVLLPVLDVTTPLS